MKRKLITITTIITLISFQLTAQYGLNLNSTQLKEKYKATYVGGVVPSFEKIYSDATMTWYFEEGIAQELSIVFLNKAAYLYFLNRELRNWTPITNGEWIYKGTEVHIYRDFDDSGNDSLLIKRKKKDCLCQK